MNKVHFTIGALALSAISMANFSESFDTGPTGWADTTVTTFGNTAGGDDVALSSGTWHALNNSAPVGLTGWFDNPTIWATHSGAGHLCANFNATTGANTIDDYFETPTLTLNNGDTLSFWTRTFDPPTFPDRLLVKMSTAGAATSAASFTSTLLTINPTLTTTGYPNAYTQFTATVSGLSGPTLGRLAFNYNVTGGGPAAPTRTSSRLMTPSTPRTRLRSRLPWPFSDSAR